MRHKIFLGLKNSNFLKKFYLNFHYFQGFSFIKAKWIANFKVTYSLVNSKLHFIYFWKVLNSILDFLGETIVGDTLDKNIDCPPLMPSTRPFRIKPKHYQVSKQPLVWKKGIIKRIFVVLKLSCILNSVYCYNWHTHLVLGTFGDILTSNLIFFW